MVAYEALYDYDVLSKIFEHLAYCKPNELDDIRHSFSRRNVTHDETLDRQTLLAAASTHRLWTLPAGKVLWRSLYHDDLTRFVQWYADNAVSSSVHRYV